MTGMKTMKTHSRETTSEWNWKSDKVRGSRKLSKIRPTDIAIKKYAQVWVWNLVMI